MDTTGWMIEVSKGWCMFLQPKFEWVSARKTLRMDLGVIDQGDHSFLDLQLLDAAGALVYAERFPVPAREGTFEVNGHTYPCSYESGHNVVLTWEVNLANRLAA